MPGSVAASDDAGGDDFEAVASADTHVPNDAEWAELVASAMHAVSLAERETERETAILAWLNEGQCGRSWTPRTRRGLRDSDLTNSRGEPLYGDELYARLAELEAPYPRAVWLSARAWMDALAQRLSTPQGVAWCRRHEVSAASVMHIGATLVAHANRRTGRSITASNATLATHAERSEGVVDRSKRVLRALGMLVDRTAGRSCLTRLEQLAAVALHGGEQHAVAGESVLVMPPTDAPQDTTRAAKPAPDCITADNISDPADAASDDESSQIAPRTDEVSAPLSVTTHLEKESLVSSKSPSARRRARATRPPSKPHRTRPTQSTAKRALRTTGERLPVPLAMQLLAAELVHPVTGIVGLRGAYSADSGRHIGAVIRVLAEAGIDPARWTARDVQAAIDAGFRSERRTWVTGVRNPVGWLHWVLSRIDWAAPSPSEVARERAAIAAVPDRAVADARARVSRPISADARAAAMQQIRADAAARAARRRESGCDG